MGYDAKYLFGSKISHHSKYLISFAICYFGLGITTANLAYEQQGFPDWLWIFVATMTLIVCLLGAFDSRFRKLAFAFLVVMPVLRSLSFTFSFLYDDVTFTVALGRVVTYGALIVNHYFVAKRPDYNIFISNVIKHSKEGESLSPRVVRKLEDMIG